jgi:hypothetical protein
MGVKEISLPQVGAIDLNRRRFASFAPQSRGYGAPGVNRRYLFTEFFHW